MKREEVFRAFLRALPLDIVAPEISIADDGDIEMDWDAGSRRVVSLAVYESGTIGFAYLLGAQASHGTFMLDPDGSIPDSILCFIRATQEQPA